jgi:single-stranded-DNA-specific exonuclease
VIGIVAGKLAEKHHKPVVLIALDKLGAKPGSGSGRSPNGVNLHAAFEQCRELLISGGGHAAAAGLKINEANLSIFRMAFLEAVSEQTSELDTEAEICVDAEATLDQLDLQAVSQIERMAPFGMGNPRPIFCAIGVELAEPPKLLGDSGRHLSVQLSQYGRRMRAVAFGKAEDWLPGLEQLSGTIDLVFRPVINEFRGYRTVEMHLTDWRVHADAHSDEVVDNDRVQAPTQADARPRAPKFLSPSEPVSSKQ